MSGMWKTALIALVVYVVAKNFLAKVVNPLISSTGITL